MRFTSQTSYDGVTEQLFTLGEIPGVLWTPEGAAGTRPLVLMGHGGGQHKKAPGIAVRARRFAAECGFAAAAVDVPGHGDRPQEDEYERHAAENQARVAAGEELAPLIADFQARVARRTVPEWRSVLDALQDLEFVGSGPVGYWGVSLGCGLGVPFVAAEPRVRAAVLGLGRGAGNCRTRRADHRPGRVPGAVGRRASATGAVPGTVRRPGIGREDPARQPGCARADLPAFELDSTLRFFARHLAPVSPGASA